MSFSPNLFEECNLCLAVERKRIYDIVFSSRVDIIVSFMADNIKNEYNNKPVSLKNFSLVRKVIL